MFNQQFYFQTIRKYVSLFGTLFNEITISKENSTTGRLEQLIRVPITYAPKDKMLARVQMDPDIDRQSASIPLPYMSFEMTNISYDSNRKLRTTGKISVKDVDNPSKLKYQYNPVAYNFGFRLYVFVKNAEDGTKIIEQILPYFTPDFTASVNLIPEMDVNMEIPIIMNSIDQEDTYEGDFKERRAIIWTLDFTLKGYIYGPVKKGAIIKFANTAYYVPSSTLDIKNSPGETAYQRYTVITPGLLANGQPTSNGAASINPLSIEVDDNFGYVIETTYGV
jgi:hypothetical protein